MLLTTRTTGGVIRIDVTTGGKDYESPPTVVISGGGGTGAQAVAHMAGTRVESIVITNQGTGYTGNPTVALTATTGGGASAIGYAYTAPARPVTFFRGRYNDLYGVDGMGRGFRWVDRPPSPTGDKKLNTEGGDDLAAEDGRVLVTERGAIGGGDIVARPIGLVKPAVAPAVTASTASQGQIVAAVQLVSPGAGYASEPAVVFTGGTPTRQAQARAIVSAGQVAGVVMTDLGAGYQSTPLVSFTGGVGTGATFTPFMLGQAATIRVVDPGRLTNDEDPPFTYPVLVNNTNGLTGFAALAIADEDNRIATIRLLAAGTGATTTGQSLSLDGHDAKLELDLVFSIASLSVESPGQGFYTPPAITVERDSDDLPLGEGRFSDAVLSATIDAQGEVSSVSVIAGGQYFKTPQVYVSDSSAIAQASLRKPLIGKYFCAIRYLDNTPRLENGPIPSSLSDIAEVDLGDGGGAIEWSLSHHGIDDRVDAMELWRSTAGQRTVFFRVATIKRSDPEWDQAFIDTLGDDQITDPAREGYGLLPLTLPSGQVNARRFQVPPGEFAVACMFQDRAWYAVDTLGLRPNSLMYSEVDEPESVPDDYELVLQENTPIPDRIVALVPLGPMMLVAQRNHLYKLMYVSQPVIDASITLAAHRGVLNDRCWCVLAGIAFLVDDSGMYAFNGSQEEPVSAPVENYWRDRLIDFSKADKFHVSADTITRTVRFYYCKVVDSEPVRALCFSAFTKAWWEESYPLAVTATAPAIIGSRMLRLAATNAGSFRVMDGRSDSGTGIPYQYRSPPLPLSGEPDGGIAIVYRPTVNDSDLRVGLHYNNSELPRANAVRTDLGAGFISEQGSTFASLNMGSRRSPLGDASGMARAGFNGNRNDRSVGADRHVAIAMAGTQAGSTVGDEIVLHAIQITGAG